MNEDIIYIDSENLEKIAELLNMYIREEREIVSNFNDSHIKIEENYNSKNNDFLNELIAGHILNLNKMINNHEMNFLLINNRIEVVREAVKKSKTIDDSINVDRIV